MYKLLLNIKKKCLNIYLGYKSRIISKEIHFHLVNAKKNFLVFGRPAQNLAFKEHTNLKHILASGLVPAGMSLL